jgi:predicted  nucleic acid-binding Zn-ribbon protein
MEVKEEFLEKLYRRIFDLEGELRDARDRLEDARKALKARDETYLTHADG